MKKTLKYLSMLLMIVLLTGCVKMNYQTTIGADKSVTIEVIYAIDASVIDNFNNEESDSENDNFDMSEDSSTFTGISIEDYDALVEKGWKVEEYSETKDDQTLEGVKILKKFANIDNITGANAKEIDLTNLLETDESFDETQFFYKKDGHYVGDFLLNFVDAEQGMSNSSYESSFDLTYNVTLPNKVISSNATKVSEDGKTLNWNLKFGKINNMDFEFSFDGATKGENLPIIIGCGIIFVLLVAVIIVAISKRKKSLPVVKNAEPIDQFDLQPVNNGQVVPTPTINNPNTIMPEITQPNIEQNQTMNISSDDQNTSI